MFYFDPKVGKLVPACEMRTHESIISLAILTPEIIICGQSNGYIDSIVLKLKKKKNNEWSMDNVQSRFCNELGYINCM